jgi:hemerythrin-like domain-containing protein
MATATQVLRHEHEAILKMVDVTERTANRLETGEPVRGEILDNLLEFFRLFVDQCHHGKEEGLLFPLLETKGIPRPEGPLGVMLAEHEMGRALVKEMVEAAAAYRAKTPGAGPRWAEAARKYADLLRAHINKENNVLFLVAEQVLSPAEQASLAEDFERLEVEEMGAGTHERLHAMMEKLVKEMGDGDCGDWS